MQDQIEGFVSSIVFSNAENGYVILRLDTAEGVVTAAGTIPGVILGERIRLTGSWVVHPKYGEQFKVEGFESVPLSGVEEIFRYLASGAVKNIGIGRAREIVDRFGTQALDIIENDPDKLAQIKGISIRTARKIGDNYQKQAGLRRLIVFFRGYNISPSVAVRVYKDYGFDSPEAVKDNPYLILSEPYGASFGEADAIAVDLGFESNSPQRVAAAVIYTLTHNLSNGHTFIPKDKLTDAVMKLIGESTGNIDEILHLLSNNETIVIDRIADTETCYLTHIFEAEQYVAAYLKTACKSSRSLIKKTKNRTMQQQVNELSDGDFEYSELQTQALIQAANHNVLVLTGGPGTGKTTTLRGILKLFITSGLRTCLCAPTGRAAKRMSELCRSEAFTIHRLLGATLDDDSRHIFDHNEFNKLDIDAIIIDESSMIDILLMDALLRALPPACRIVLVGDADQLPPIGPGSMFSELIRSGVIPVIALTEIFRQAADSGIVCLAHNVNKGIMPDLTEKYPDMYFLQRRSDEQLADTVAQLCSERLPKNMNIDPSLIQVLTPTRKGSSGTFSLNKKLREMLNPPGPGKKEKQIGDMLYRTGDKVMQIKNNYDILWKSKPSKSMPAEQITRRDGAGVFNGDIGIVSSINNEKETLTVDFDDKLVTYSFEQLSELEPAYAVTIHKSQGSEYHAVVLVLADAAPPLLTRSVLYTAVTRAKNLLIIAGSAQIMNKMVQNDKRQKRYTALRHRLCADS